MITIYAVFPAERAASEPAVALFADRIDAEFFIDACKNHDREYSADLIIEECDISNVALMEAS